MQADVLTTNLPDVMRQLSELIAGQSEAGERYAVTLTVVGPLTTEEAVTALWQRVRRVQFPVS